MSDSTPPEHLAKVAPLRKNLLHQTALALQGQFRNVIFDSDNRLHRIRFEVHPLKATDDDGVELYGHLEFEGELDELLKTLRPIFPFEILSTTHSWNQPTNQSTNKPTNQPTNQSNHQLIHKLLSQVTKCPHLVD